MNTTSQALKKTLLFFLCLAYTSHTVTGAHRIGRYIPRFCNCIATNSKRSIATRGTNLVEKMNQYAEEGRYTHVSSVYYLDANGQTTWSKYEKRALKHEKEGHIDDAIACYKEAIAHIKKASDGIEVLPDLCKAYRKLAALLEKEGYIDDAIACYEEVAHMEKKINDLSWALYEVYRKLAALFKQKGDGQQAELYGQKLEMIYYMKAFMGLEKRYNRSIKAFHAIALLSPKPWTLDFFEAIFEHLGYKEAKCLFIDLRRFGIVRSWQPEKLTRSDFYVFDKCAQEAVLSLMARGHYREYITRYRLPNTLVELEYRIDEFRRNLEHEGQDTSWLNPHKQILKGNWWSFYYRAR